MQPEEYTKLRDLLADYRNELQLELDWERSEDNLARSNLQMMKSQERAITLRSLISSIEDLIDRLEGEG